MNENRKTIRRVSAEAAAQIEAATTWLEENSPSSNDNFVSFADLCDFVEGSLHDPSGVKRRIIGRDPKLAETCRALIQKFSSFEPFFAIAASGHRLEDIKDSERGFEVIFRPASSREGKLHVIITFDKALWPKLPDNMMIFTKEGVVSEPLEVDGGRAHLLLAEDSDVVRAFAQWRELYFS